MAVITTSFFEVAMTATFMMAFLFTNVLNTGLMYLTQQRVALAMNAKCDTMRSIKKARHCVNSADHETQEYRLCLLHRVSQFTAHIK